jgi:hypothetical protein
VDRARLALAVALGLACGAEQRPAAAPAADAGPDYAGLYEVSGYTTVRRSGHRRRIAGTVIVAHAAPGTAAPYTATFDLETEFATPEGPIQADVIGSASASADSTELAGTAETRILMASIPGLDPTFPWIPGRLGPRVLSKFRMTPSETKGAFEIEIESEAAPGESYEATRTALRAARAASGPREHANAGGGR